MNLNQRWMCHVVWWGLCCRKGCMSCALCCFLRALCFAACMISEAVTLKKPSGTIFHTIYQHAQRFGTWSASLSLFLVLSRVQFLFLEACHTVLRCGVFAHHLAGICSPPLGYGRSTVFFRASPVTAVTAIWLGTLGTREGLLLFLARLILEGGACFWIRRMYFQWPQHSVGWGWGWVRSMLCVRHELSILAWTAAAAVTTTWRRLLPQALHCAV